MASRLGRVGVVMGVWTLGASMVVGAPPPGSFGAPGVEGGGDGKSAVGVVKVPDPNDPAEKAYQAAQKKRADMEKELRQVRAKYFKGIRNTEIRQVGLSKLRAYTDPAVYPLLLELFKDEDKEARGATLDLLIERASDEADAAIAWAAVFDGDKWFREEAAGRLKARTKDAGVSYRVKSVIALGLKSKKESDIAAAAQMAGDLKLFEAIPMLINAQVGGAGGGAGGQRADDGGDAALAYILVGKQIAFVSDLTPVVGDSAVGFDPTLSVATDGVILRVIDAYVITYRMDVHNSLVALGNAGWDGRDTAGLGWDGQKWQDWYAKEFVPYREKLAQAGKDRPA